MSYILCLFPNKDIIELRISRLILHTLTVTKPDKGSGIVLHKRQSYIS